MALPPPQAYAMTQEDKLKYDSLFSGYDADGDGFILGGEAVAIFNHSGLDVQVLRGVWALADDDKDSKLSKLEFAVAFHLIMCIRYESMMCFLLYSYSVTHSFRDRSLPLPPGLPAPLKAFLTNGGVVPPPSPITPVVPQPLAVAPKVTVSEAFAAVEVAAPPAARSAAIQQADADDVSSGIANLTDTTKKLVAVQGSAIEVATDDYLLCMRIHAFLTVFFLFRSRTKQYQGSKDSYSD